MLPKDHPFNYLLYFNLCADLLDNKAEEPAFRTVINRCYLTAVMTAAEILQPHIGKLPRDHGFYDEVEKSILMTTGDSDLMGDLKSLRKDRVEADYNPERRFTLTKAQDCLIESEQFVQAIQKIF